MALSKKTTVNAYGQELTFENAYYMIDSMNGNKISLTFSIIIFNDDTKENVLYQRNYTFQPSVQDESSNFYKQGYEYLKTLSEFSNAIDC